MSNLVQVIKKVALEAFNASNPTTLVIGTVTSIAPLIITVDQKLPLDEDFLILTKHVQDHYVDITVSHLTKYESLATHSHSISDETEETHIDAHTHSTDTGETGQASATAHKHKFSITSAESGGGEHQHEYKGRKKIMLHYGLKQGESVLLLKMQGGQKYIVLDRLGEVPTEGEWI